jgi:hypothetical protein
MSEDAATTRLPDARDAERMTLSAEGLDHKSAHPRQAASGVR